MRNGCPRNAMKAGRADLGVASLKFWAGFWPEKTVSTRRQKRIFTVLTYRTNKRPRPHAESPDAGSLYEKEVLKATTFVTKLCITVKFGESNKYRRNVAC